MDEVTGEKHSVFEELLNAAFAGLRDEGWHVTTVQPMSDGFVIFANRVAQISPPAVSTTVFPDSEVTAHYTWRENGECKSQTFSSLGESLRVVSADFKGELREPVSVHLTALTAYNRYELWRLTNQGRK